MSITQQKSDLREIIHRKFERHIRENPKQASDIAMTAIRLYTGELTLNQLRYWYFALFADRWAKFDDKSPAD